MKESHNAPHVYLASRIGLPRSTIYRRRPIRSRIAAMTKLIVGATLIAVSISHSWSQAHADDSADLPPNVVLVVADGLGLRVLRKRSCQHASLRPFGRVRDEVQ